MKIKLTTFLLSFVSLTFFGQSITGTVFDSQKKPLKSANIIAKPLVEKAKLKFAIANENGFYKLELDKEIPYELYISYLGYKSQIATIKPNSEVKVYDFLLVAENETLKEIVIKSTFKPVIVKVDTLVFDVKSFTTGRERKLKEQLNKLPGVEVDKNGNVTVQGKKVTKFLVEGDVFFGGGTKLGVENIPADAVDKVEVIDHFSQVAFLKTVSNSDDLALNIKLKADKKKFVFGDVEAAAEVANDNNFYRAHAGLFYYSKKSNFSFIADANSIGTSAFGFADMVRFEGGNSSFFSSKKSLANLDNFLDNNTDFAKHSSKFSALNFVFNTSPKLKISGFALFSGVNSVFQTQIENTYLQNNQTTFENVKQENLNQNKLGIANVKVEFFPNKTEKVEYNIQLKSSLNTIETALNSTSQSNTAVFETTLETPNVTLTQFLEWHKSINENHSTTLVINHSFETNKPQNQWVSNQVFLNGLLPLQTDLKYDLRQLKESKSNAIDALFKHYWILNKSNHIYTNIGINNNAVDFSTSENQLLSNGNEIKFDNFQFGNNVKYSFNDAYVGLEYRFKISKFTGTPAVYFHQYNVSNSQFGVANCFSKSLLLPQFKCVYDFNKSENLNFNYQLATSFPEASQLASRFVFQNYNAVFRGNASLENELYHGFVMRYTKMNLYRGITLNGLLNFNKKIRTLRDEVQLSGINQLLTPNLTGNNESNWRFMGSVSKNIKKYIIKLNTNLSWFNYLQTVNNSINANNRNNQEVGIELKTGRKHWIDASISYTKSFSQFKGITNSNFEKDEINVNAEKVILKNFTFRFDYQLLQNKNDLNQRNNFDIVNVSLRYQKPNSAFTFELFANNVLNTTAKNNFTFSDFLISQQITATLPRIVMLSVSYKL